MFDPMDLDDQDAYLRWRRLKLAHYPAGIERIRIEIDDLHHPTAAELDAIKTRVARFNMALIQARPEDVCPAGVLAVGRALGLQRTDANLFADTRAVSHIEAATATRDNAGGGARRTDFIPYTNRPLSWHTDGYYNAPEDQVEAWTLFCVRPAHRGGVNALLDPEIAYIRLRDDSPRHIEALTHPRALLIPAHTQAEETLRPARIGPVFSVRRGHLHMRYSARGKHVVWRDNAATALARKALDQLFSSADAFTFHHRLEPGEGIVSNNVLHNRSGFEDLPAGRSGRLLYRVRYRDRIETKIAGERPTSPGAPTMEHRTQPSGVQEETSGPRGQVQIHHPIERNG
ncbi:TauD/TfdA family dioxygenase [Thiocystis violacea]|uniref:TauD/TfdA family dioxygenase n=1 Tax=Thiocystis violacea TaxID=13725 RepID=UPI001907A50B|nr:TauD/TfdA family dioxygenase [Thiocystis violacea]MBK1723187.1 hypothetical protein [Thiocystis violacea]